MDYEYQENVEVNVRAGIGHILMVTETEDRNGWYGILFAPAGDKSDPDRFDMTEYGIFSTPEQARDWCERTDKTLASTLVDEIEAFLAA